MRQKLYTPDNVKKNFWGCYIEVIRVYDDKITIWNDGQWPDRIDVDKVYERHPSIPHNPKMADVFYRSGEIEAWGSGFDKIKMECDQASAPYPEIHANPKGGVELVCNACDLYLKLLRYGRYYDTYHEEGEPEAQASMSQQTVKEKKSVDRMMDILSKKLSEKEKEKLLPIVEYLKSHEKIEAQTVMVVTGKSRATASRYLQRLVELDILEKRGDSIATAYYRR